MGCLRGSTTRHPEAEMPAKRFPVAKSAIRERAGKADGRERGERAGRKQTGKERALYFK